MGYPIVPLGRIGSDGRLPHGDYIGYLRRLEATLIRALAELGLAAGQLEGLTGVWIQPDVASRCAHCPPEARRAPSKIAAIGVKVDARGISRHGFALNITPDMSYWKGIVPCGLMEHPTISLADLLNPTPFMSTVADHVAAAFGREFGYRMQEAEDLEPRSR